MLTKDELVAMIDDAIKSVENARAYEHLKSVSSRHDCLAWTTDACFRIHTAIMAINRVGGVITP